MLTGSLHLTVEGTQWIQVSHFLGSWWRSTRHVMLSSLHAQELALIKPHSRQAIQKYIKANNKVDNLTDAAFKGHVNRAIASGEEKGDFSRPKGKLCAIQPLSLLSSTTPYTSFSRRSQAATVTCNIYLRVVQVHPVL